MYRSYVKDGEGNLKNTQKYVGATERKGGREERGVRCKQRERKRKPRWKSCIFQKAEVIQPGRVF